MTSDALHLWSAALDPPPAVVAGYGMLLAAEESARADRFRFARDRRRYTVARGVLRTLLGRYLQRPSTEIVFSYSQHGKPYLPDAALHFNVSHSDALALYAFAWVEDGRETAVGVDVEQVRQLEDADDIAARFFAVREYEAWRKIPSELQPQAFFNCWTRKEAFIKAVGDGLSYPLDQFEVTLAPWEPVRLLSVRGSVEEAGRWMLQALDPAPGFVGALATNSRERRVQIYQYTHRLDSF